MRRLWPASRRPMHEGRGSTWRPLPDAAMHDLIERSPVEPLKRPERTVCRVAERDKICEEVVVREGEDLPSELLILYGRVARDDGDRSGGAANVPRPLPNPSEVAELVAVGHQHEVPRLPVLRRRRKPASLEDPRQVLLAHQMRPPTPTSHEAAPARGRFALACGPGERVRLGRIS
jgi:hypothetical protein